MDGSLEFRAVLIEIESGLQVTDVGAGNIRGVEISGDGRVRLQNDVMIRAAVNAGNVQFCVVNRNGVGFDVRGVRIDLHRQNGIGAENNDAGCFERIF